METKSKYYIYYNGFNVITLYAHSKWEAIELASFMLPILKREKLIAKKTKIKSNGKSRKNTNAVND
jgi:hypothetical protein